MKIAAIATSEVPATTANSIQVIKTCQSLAQCGHKVSLWVPGLHPTPWTELADLYGLSEHFEIRWLRGERSFKRYDFAWKAVRQAQLWQAEVVYTWLPQAAVLSLWQQLPAMLEMHDRPTGRMGPWLLRQFARHTGRKRLLLITHALQKALESEFKVRLRPNEVRIVPNGVELERYQDLPSAAQARSQLGLLELPTAVYTGHFYSGRGLELLFELARRLPAVQFLWVGGRPEAVLAWQERARTNDVYNLHLTGFIDQNRLPLYQAAADVLLMPYERKIAGSSGGNSADICSPMKMFDYMAAGRAILTSDLPVIHEVLNEKSAVFCPPEDVQAWEQALSALLADSALRDRLASQARQDVQRYAWRERAQEALHGF